MAMRLGIRFWVGGRQSEEPELSSYSSFMQLVEDASCTEDIIWRWYEGKALHRGRGLHMVCGIQVMAFKDMEGMAFGRTVRGHVLGCHEQLVSENGIRSMHCDEQLRGGRVKEDCFEDTLAFCHTLRTHAYSV